MFGVDANYNSGLNLHAYLNEDIILKCFGRELVVKDLSQNKSWHTAIYSRDSSGNLYMCIYNNYTNTFSSVSYINHTDELDLSIQTSIFSGKSEVLQDWDGQIAEFYFTDQHIDFSQESNRNLFVNQLGYVRSLDEPIAQGLIPEPLIYLKFDDPNNLGKNSGTGGDFVVNGSVTQGSDFTL